MSEDLLKVKNLLIARGCSKRTISNYISCINRFKKYYEGRNLTELKEQDILDYLKDCFIDLELSTATVNVNRAAIKYYFLVNFNIDFNKTLLPYCKVTKRFPILLTKEQVLTIINTESSLKHKLWFVLGYGSGLRIGEVATLKVSDVLSSEHKLRIVGKGNKERYVPLPDYTLYLLRLYWIQNKHKIINDYLFPGVLAKTELTHISRTTVQEAFCKIKKNNNLDNAVSFHTLRHCFATEFIKNGGNIWELKSILGHASINSTMIYLHMARDFKDVYSPLNGVNNGK